MNTQTSLVAEQIRLQQWADQIRDCQNRPSDMKVDAWCREHGITKANYYYRLRRVREACLKLCDPSPSFVELTAPAESIPAKVSHTHSSVAAALHTKNGIASSRNLLMPEYILVATMVRDVPEYKIAHTEESPRQMLIGIPMIKNTKKERNNTALII